jgi:hypothetical protein
MNVLAQLTSFLWWMMLLSTAAIILHDIVSGIPRKRMESRPSATRQKFTSRTEDDDPEMLAGRIRRALQRPENFRAIRKEAAEVIASAALAANAIPSSRVTSRAQLQVILHEPEVARFVEQQLFHESSETKLSRGDIINAFEGMVAALEKAAKELA